MRAAALTEYGPPEVLRSVELPDPRVGPGQVRVRPRIAGVQPFDCGVRTGVFPRTLTGDFPIVPGNEFAGTIDRIGPGVTGFAVGDSVLGFCTLGAYAESLVVAADQVARKPGGMSWETAGCFSGSAQGARNAFAEMRVTSGDVVLINGASGGLGTMAVQLARAKGAAKVVGTASEANHDYVRALGAVPVAYGPGLADRLRAVVPEGFDTALGFEPDGLRASLDVVHDRTRVVTMVYSDEIAALGIQDWTGVRSAEGMSEMLALYERGDLTVHVRARYPLADAAAAHRDVGAGHGRGKVVISIA
ncbi:NADP-dependent oxidoreductase [Embleya hyalina]|uniref:Oxidoreductase n=1 Tax=Embleya hyalina TaxID=516124 RepID=A0A401YQI0_9ACTN|nr:NADP-dependent oxidoreductase [Embleya hyalina]GCD96843.1 oxidoreductase [Embleya hyalina]